MTNPTLPALLDALFRGPVNDILGDRRSRTSRRRTCRAQDLVTAFLTGFPGVNQQKTVTPSEMLRLNTGIAAKPAAQQSTFGVAGGDLAGFPNGRRPGDDVVDIALRVVMGRLCHPVPVNGIDHRPRPVQTGGRAGRQSRVHGWRADQRGGLRRDASRTCARRSPARPTEQTGATVMNIQRKLGLAVLAVLTAGLLAACGGGGGYDNPPPPPAAAGADRSPASPISPCRRTRRRRC